jgi:hypothetical protein
MFLTSLLFLAQRETQYQQPAYFIPVALAMLVGGTIGWLVATVLGFARARAFGPSARWFAFASLFMILYHLQFVLLALGLIMENPNLTLAVGAFFNFFALVAAFCAIMGFVRLTSPR